MWIRGADLQLPAKAGTNLSTPQGWKTWLASGEWNDRESNPVPPDHKTGVLATTLTRPFIQQTIGSGDHNLKNSSVASQLKLSRLFAVIWSSLWVIICYIICPTCDWLFQLVYHDDGPFLLTTQSSFNELAQRIADVNTEFNAKMEYFRPTMVVDGDSVPFDEVREAHV
jgi:hypothetical protein